MHTKFWNGIAAVLATGLPLLAWASPAHQFTFSGPDRAGYVRVSPAAAYDPSRGFGFEPGNGATPGMPWQFSVDVPEGNYDVTVTLGDDERPATTTIKAELRRLMLENVSTAPGETVQRTFSVNVRTPDIPEAGSIRAGSVKLNEPRETVREANAWDRRLTLEINGASAAVRSIAIAPSKAATVFLLGDSTVCDQRGEPFASWGQMLPRFFQAGVAVANHGQSGETYRGSLARRRIDKIAASIKPGDTVLLQFGHNDQKQVKSGKGGPFTTYKTEIKRHIDMIRARGGNVVVLSPVERRRFDRDGKVTTTLDQYADAARQAAQENKADFIDLNAMSKAFYQALGAEGSKAAFASRGPGHLDNTHHSPYGAYELAKFVAYAMREARLPVARLLSPDLGAVEPSRPLPFSLFRVPPSMTTVAERPAGDDGNK